MTINKINGNNIPEKNIGKSRQSGGAKESAFEGAPKAGAHRRSISDKFTLSEIDFKGDAAFAKKELEKLDNRSFEALRKIKARIERGEYNSSEVHKKIGALVEQDLNAIEHVLATPSEAGTAAEETSLSEGYRRYLIENPKVISRVAEQIAADLKRL
ncbi:hypothetical protein [Fodinibius sediminis]|uniref:Uncharacterized protein n=1 Tax=Fodinibius sediminis TaxID=1214077 RepID=A0A521CJM9_9BACT|nr:hypothetical protein [Fodinibius sediminis]SMO59612.1 hypothetical protein SAMN06265218_106125 [Fodinibius sediminis]